MKEIGQAVDSMTARDDLENFLKKPENAQKLNGLVEDMRYALIEYQVCIPNRLALNVFNIFLRLRCNKRSTTKVVSRL